MNKEEIIKAIEGLPMFEIDKLPISAMDSININDLFNTIDRFNKIPTYQDLLKENKQLKDNWNKLKEWSKHERKVSLGMQNGYGVSLCDCMINKMQELEKGGNNG